VEPAEGPEAGDEGPAWTTWESGEPAKAAAALVVAGERLCDAVDLKFGQKVLDVGTGTGNTALSAARRGARAVGLDPMREVLAIGVERARAERLKVRFVAGAAESLPFQDACFDVSLSTFGVMFTTDAFATIEELIRVTREGGAVGVASWTPTGLLGKLYRLVGAEAGEGYEGPTDWGRREQLSTWFSREAAEMTTATRTVKLRGPSPEAFGAYLARTLGPVVRAFEERDAASQDQLKADLTALLTEANRAEDGSFDAPAEYLEAVVRLR
jgi:ubiquinone/menaquinone biosynthesis C-methylase UbiE